MIAKPKKERNIDAFVRVLNGETLPAVGLEYGITKSRVQQIIRSMAYQAVRGAVDFSAMTIPAMRTEKAFWLRVIKQKRLPR